MSGVRRAFLDRSPGEARAVILLDGRPERLLITREDDPTPRLHARYAARVDAVSQRMGLARLDLGPAPGALRLRQLSVRVCEGDRLQVEIVAEPVRGKPAAVRLLAPASGPPGLTRPPPTIEAQLKALDCGQWVEGDAAREQADIAQAQAAAQEHASPNGLNLSIEPTRALTSIDVDLAEVEPALSVTNANLAAIGEAARLLRLKSLGGLVAIDLIGFPKDVRRLHAAALDAFAADGPEVAIAAVSRFGVLQLAKPHAAQPLHERLLDGAGRPNLRTLAHEVVRGLERQGGFNPGARMLAVCQPDVAATAAPWVSRLGPRFTVRADLGADRDHPDIQNL